LFKAYTDNQVGWSGFFWWNYQKGNRP